MQLYLYQIEAGGESALVGVSRAQLARLGAWQPPADDLKPSLDRIGYLAVWKCVREAASGAVSVHAPLALFARDVRTFTRVGAVAETLASRAAQAVGLAPVTNI